MDNRNNLKHSKRSGIAGNPVERNPFRLHTLELDHWSPAGLARSERGPPINHLHTKRHGPRYSGNRMGTRARTSRCASCFNR
jgi:hypothetical protein